MKLFIALSALVALASARPSVLYSEPAYIAAGPLVSQYHSQDSLGQYTYGYAGGPSAKNEVRSLDGVTRGSYSYVDAKGELQTVAYAADAFNGFRVAATNLPEAPKDLAVAPEPVKDTPEVLKARAEHLAVVQAGGIAPLPETRIATPALEPVKETEEVAKARADHLMALENAKIAGPAEAKLEPVKETPEVALARSEHLKAVENAKTRNAIVEAIDNTPVQILSPTLIGAPQVRFAVAEPTIRLAESQIRLAEPQIRLAESQIRFAEPTIRLAESQIRLAEPTIRFEPTITKIEPTVRLAAPVLNEVKEIKLEAPVQKLDKIETPLLRVAQAPLAYSAPYGLTYSNLVSPYAPLTYTYGIEPTRLIRSAKQ